MVALIGRHMTNVLPLSRKHSFIAHFIHLCKLSFSFYTQFLPLSAQHRQHAQSEKFIASYGGYSANARAANNIRTSGLTLKTKASSGLIHRKSLNKK
jgi:hypothetical protein